MDSDYFDETVAGLNRDYRRGEWIVKGSFVFLVPLTMTLWVGAWVLATILILLMTGNWWMGVRKRNIVRQMLTELGES